MSNEREFFPEILDCIDVFANGIIGRQHDIEHALYLHQNPDIRRLALGFSRVWRFPVAW